MSEFRGSEEVSRIEIDYAFDPLRLHAQNPKRYPFLLESAARGTPRSRFDILFAFPQSMLFLDADGQLSLDGSRVDGKGFLDALDDWFRREGGGSRRSESLPFLGGWFVYLGYELVGEIEPVVGLGELDIPWPVAAAARVPVALVRDHERERAFAVAESAFSDCLRWMLDDLGVAGKPTPGDPDGGTTTMVVNMTEAPPEEYLEGISRIKNYIRDGDVFQVNLSRAWRGGLASGADAAGLYRRLRAANPAPFAGLARLGEFAILSSSPERLYSVRAGRVETRPIAGTHPRNIDESADRQLSLALLAHPKERAEHIMLIDLERNDLGRVCETGSVEVSELMVLESYTHVHHIVSNVRGRLRSDTTPADVIRAVFPGGTITGCPKVRCMEIIRELERIRRGPYTGAFGYLDRNGDADFNILIRTIAVCGHNVELRAGGGIVADSVPERELDETREKARGPLRALGAMT
ncbi:MAG TPA: aminodeoxychorismate synthase component I [Gammaproteobacteria bacterium]|nr:aminodeoxychorismate synthase component I [Gammaproteobacteria bacterium]